MKCPICNYTFHGDVTKEGVVFQQKQYPFLDEDVWICNQCYRNSTEDFIIDKIKNLPPDIIETKTSVKKSGFVEFIAWFIWGSGTAFGLGVMFWGLTEMRHEPIMAIILMVIGGGFLAACLAKIIKRIRA